MKALFLIPMAVGMIVIGSAQTFTKITTGPITANGGYTQGASWGDYNNDGYQDLIVNNGSRFNYLNVNFLYLNDGNGGFTRIINTLSAETANFSGGCWGDYDNDGDLDYFAPTFDGTPGYNNNRLFRNNGDGSFSKINSTPVNETGDSAGGTWVDIDNDGDLDLFVINDVTPENYLYQNDNGVFTKITSSIITNNPVQCISGSWGDIDNNGGMDLFVCNILGENNSLYLNDGNGNFTKVTEGEIVNDGKFAINGSWGDYNNDGSLDLFVSVRDGRDLLYRNNGDGTFERITSGAIVNDSLTSGSNGWGDFDNDGDLDIFMAIVNGSSVYYRNDGNDTFTRLLDLGAITNDTGSYRTSCDHDNDGDLDVLVTNGIFQAPFENYLYRNDTDNGNSWVNITLRGTVSNTTGIGARVYAKATINGLPVRQMREVAQMNAYGGHSSLRAHFGLGDATIIDSVIVRWPASDITDVYTNVDVNRLYLAVELTGLTPITGIAQDVASVPQNITLYQNYPNPFNPSTRITYVLPTSSHVILKIYNLLGQEVKTLVNARQPPGAQSAVWDGRDNSGRLASSGIYIYQLQAGREVQSRKMLLVR